MASFEAEAGTEQAAERDTEADFRSSTEVVHRCLRNKYISLKDNKTRLVVDRDKPKFSYGLGMTGGYQINQSLPL